MGRFSVDTHLFRELGALLVGRDSTALVELIKNAYDADATEVTVTGFKLDDPETGTITIVDNGNGMTPEEFTRGFLRIASRLKEAGERRSPRFLRRFTGAKGVGRLAAHKLARQLEVVSISSTIDIYGRKLGVDASIDWDQIEAKETLDEVIGDDAVRVTEVFAPSAATSGTRIMLSGLRRPWTPHERTRFMEEVQTFEPPPVLTSPLPSKVVPAALVPALVFRDEQREGTWKVNLEAEFDAGHPYWQNLAETADWLVEIDALDRQMVRYAITTTSRRAREIGENYHRVFEEPHADSQNGPFFQARILARDGSAWQNLSRGIRVFMEGFRVLPYGESGNDWLGIDRDVNARSARLDLPPEFGTEFDPFEGLSMRPNRQYFGGVFLTQANAPTLRMLVNREGFIPEGGYDRLVRIVRTGIDLSVRARAAARYEERADRRLARLVPVSGADAPRPLLPVTDRKAVELARSVHDLARQARQQLAVNDIPAAQQTIARFTQEAETLVSIQADAISEHALFRVLASVGTQLSAFVHEIQALLGMAQGLELALNRLREEPAVTPAVRRQLAATIGLAGDLRRNLERQASYLLDVLTPDLAIYLEDTQLRIRDKIALLFETELERRMGSSWRKKCPLSRLEREIFAIEDRLFVINSDPDLIANLGFCLGHYLRSRAAKRDYAWAKMKTQHSTTETSSGRIPIVPRLE